MNPGGGMPHRLQLRVDADLADVDAAVRQLRTFLDGAQVDARRAHMGEVVLEEVLSNILRHGSRVGRTPRIDIDVDVRDASVLLLVNDDGPPFDPLAAPPFDPEAPLEARSGGGMGIHLIRRLTRALRYARLGGSNRLEIAL